MLMVVFGAGASYDSVPSRSPRIYSLENRPPLSHELFADRPRFVDAMSRFPKCQPIIPFLQRPDQDTTVERILEKLQADASDYPERHQQLASIRYYLHFMIWECERYWKDDARGITNYKTLLDQIHRWRKVHERVCLVTFNYDRMLEEALPTVGVEIKGLSDYIANDNHKVIKLHGSVNWAREVDSHPIGNPTSRNTWDVVYELIDRVADLKISQRYRMVTEYPIGNLDQSVLFPALAIPFESKRDYECPPEHLNALRGCLPEVTKILVIGWRGMEAHFLKLLAENLRPGLRVRVLVVAGSAKEARKVAERLEGAGINGHFSVSEGGFTEFIVRSEAEEFLKR